MKSVCLRRLLPTLVALAAIWVVATPAQAQLAVGCACPAGFVPNTSSTCIHVASKTIQPALCPGRDIGHIAAVQQQQSFWGINQMLQIKRDQLQATPVNHATGSQISGYDSSRFDDPADSLSYASSPQKKNPLANLYNAAPAETPANPVWGTWLQGLGDWEHDRPLAITDFAHSTSTYTGQGGVDYTKQGILSADDALVLGLVSSWMNGHTGYHLSPVTLDLSGPGIGLYTEYVRGGFSTDVTVKVDFLQMREDFAGTAPNVLDGLVNQGVSGNAQYKFTGFMGSDKSFIEPTAGFSLTHTSFASPGAHSLEDAYTVKLQAGARIGTTWDLGSGVSVDANLKALIYGDAIAQGTSVAGASDAVFTFNTPISPTDAGYVRGELDPELCFNLPDNYSLTLSGQLRYGQAIYGGSAGVNLRKQF
jgi:hypothetical protein